jgi:hypothetical protein
VENAKWFTCEKAFVGFFVATRQLCELVNICFVMRVLESWARQKKTIDKFQKMESGDIRRFPEKITILIPMRFKAVLVLRPCFIWVVGE